MRIKRPKSIDNILHSGEYTELIGASSGKAVVLLSGGIDSTVALVLAKKSGLEVIGLEFSYEGRPSKETNMVDKICELTNTELYTVSYPAPVRKISSEKVEISESNTLYFSIAGGFAHANNIKYIIAGPILNDWINTQDERASPKHYKTLNELLKREYLQNPPKIITPLIYLNKVEVVRIGLSIGTPLHLTHSCPHSSESPCGKCAQCIEREEAFSKVNN